MNAAPSISQLTTPATRPRDGDALDYLPIPLSRGPMERPGCLTRIDAAVEIRLTLRQNATAIIAVAPEVLRANR